METKTITLDISNIGLIKSANLDISCLTVIAGENDSGKSTVGKVMMALIKADNTARHKVSTNQSNNFSKNRVRNFDKQIELLFDNEITQNGTIRLSINQKKIYDVTIEKNKCVKFDGISHKGTRDFLDCTFIQTPLVWDLYEFFVSIATLRTENDIYGYENSIQYPYVLWDLYVKLTKKRMNCDINEKLIGEIEKIIQGNFIKDNLGKYYYEKKNGSESSIKVPLKNIATGIKNFGIVQILLKNCYINEFGFFIFDEPEIHLHPKWQLKFANIITKLSQNGVKIIVNTHSPYMVEALQRYSKKYKVKANFYLADDGKIEQIENSNEKTLSKIFSKLSEPFDAFDKMDSEAING
ncbi:MAG: ATP-binding protein [Campylobacterales bacterium]|nr:ATP-binding protein [Campylobacterales bacterium]